MFIKLVRIVVIVGLTMLIIGAISNSESRPTCGLAHPRFLFIGGIMCFVHSLFCIVYYVSAIASWKEGKAHRDTRSQESHAWVLPRTATEGSWGPQSLLVLQDFSSSSNRYNPISFLFWVEFSKHLMRCKLICEKVRYKGNILFS